MVQPYDGVRLAAVPYSQKLYTPEVHDGHDLLDQPSLVPRTAPSANRSRNRMTDDAVPPSGRIWRAPMTSGLPEEAR